MREFGFYYKELLLALKKPLPAIVFGLLFALIIWSVIYCTKKIVNRSWEREPEKLDKITKIKIELLKDNIKLLAGRLKEVRKENLELRHLIKGIRSLTNGD